MGDQLLAIVHRAGNDLDAARAALAAGADLIEADIHLYRGELELRHAKTAGPSILWDRLTVTRRRSVVVPYLADLLAVADGDPRLLLDLKGIDRGVAPAVAAAVRGRGVTVCTQHWWMLRAFAADPGVRVVMSAGSRRGLRRLRALVRRPGADLPFAVCVRRDLLSPAVVAELRAAVGGVWTWPVYDARALADAHRLGVTGVIGTDLDLLRRPAG